MQSKSQPRDTVMQCSVHVLLNEKFVVERDKNYWEVLDDRQEESKGKKGGGGVGWEEKYFAHSQVHFQSFPHSQFLRENSDSDWMGTSLAHSLPFHLKDSNQLLQFGEVLFTLIMSWKQLSSLLMGHQHCKLCNN